MIKQVRTVTKLVLACVLICNTIATYAEPVQVQGAAVEATHQLTVDDTVGQLLDNAASRAVLEAEVPVLVGNTQIAQARALSLRSLQPFVPTLLTAEKLAAVDAALVSAGAKSVPGQEAPAAVVTDPRKALALDTSPLWEGRAPGATGDNPLDMPTLTAVGTDGATSFGTAVIVAPGGGYQMLATGHEGRQVADWFAAHGVTAFVLNYRLCSAGYRHPTQLQDAQRAIRWVRAHAQEYGVSPDRIGMIGFSAGGHLTAMAATLSDPGDPDAQDPVERQSSRPDFAILAYAPVGVANPGWKPICIAGDTPDERTLRDLTPLKNISSRTPPTFIFHTSDDELVPPQNATRYYDALLGAGVSAELHIFASGHHGLGLAMTDETLGVWPLLLADWLRGQNLIGATAGMPVER